MPWTNVIPARDVATESSGGPMRENDTIHFFYGRVLGGENESRARLSGSVQPQCIRHAALFAEDVERNSFVPVPIQMSCRRRDGYTA